MKKFYRYVGAALTLQTASRIVPIVDDPASASSPWAAIDESSGDTVAVGNNRNNVIVLITNTEATNTMTVTQTVYGAVAGIDTPDETYSIPTGDMAIIGPINHPNLQTGDVCSFSYASAGTPDGFIIAIKVVANDA